jgi:hypothetical protein
VAVLGAAAAALAVGAAAAWLFLHPRRADPDPESPPVAAGTG